MNTTVKSLIFWVVLIVVGVSIWKFSETFERIESERVAAAHAWLKAYAPESAKIAIQEELPAAVSELTEDMRRYLRAVALAAETLPEYPGGAQWQNLLFDAAAGLGMRTNRDSFAAIYLAFLGRDSGPRAGWLLASLDKDFVVRRLLEAADATPVTNGAPS